MIVNDFKIDFENKKIYYNPDGSEKTYTINELYSFLQDTFDEPGNMTYEIPITTKLLQATLIKAKSKRKYFLINGWTIDKKGLKHLKGGTLNLGVEPLDKV